ncbi:MAG: hypothetical protein CVU56_02885 [Deltaproteobacteria bacterium HGW-Deltaproteobacteria-14]|nr:MAG: hypothetical protein CVU56_02885 [Deltaproteobacteria bacterium HGW-Deltaproteobacteria-14]
MPITTGRVHTTMRAAAMATLIFAAAGWCACGTDSACPNGTTGSPCELVSEPSERPEIPSAPDRDTLAPDAGPSDGSSGDDGNSTEDAGDDTDATGSTEDADASAVRRRWAIRLASNEAVGGNEVRDRETSYMHAAYGAATAGARRSGGAPDGWVTRRGAVGTRMNDRETRDGDGDALSVDARANDAGEDPPSAARAPRRQRLA